MRKININDFRITMRDGTVFTLNTPKLKVLKKIMAVGKNLQNAGDDETGLDELDQLSEAVALALSNNKEKRKVDVDYVDNNMNLDEIRAFITEYFGWVGSVFQEKN